MGLSIISINRSLTMIYFFNYIIISIPLINILRLTLGNHLFILTQQTKINNIIPISLILSLGGLPPLLGFISKLVILISLIEIKLILLTVFIFVGTLISLYFYLNISLILIIKSYKNIQTVTPNKIYTPIVPFNLLGRFIIYPIIII